MSSLVALCLEDRERTGSRITDMAEMAGDGKQENYAGFFPPT